MKKAQFRLPDSLLKSIILQYALLNNGGDFKEYEAPKNLNNEKQIRQDLMNLTQIFFVIHKFNYCGPQIWQDRRIQGLFGQFGEILRQVVG